MSHSLTKPGGWALNTKLLSAEITAIDEKTRDSVDKTIAGDTISGVLTFDGGGSAGIYVQGGATVDLDPGSLTTFVAGSFLTCNANASFNGDTYLAGNTTLANCAVTSGNTLEVEPGATLGVGGEVLIIGAGAKLSTASGGVIELGDDDYPTLGAGHTGLTQSAFVPLVDFAVDSANFTINFSGAIPCYKPFAVGSSMTILLNRLHNRATLSSVDVFFVAGTGHAGLPAQAPWMSLYQVNMAAGGSLVRTALSTSPSQAYTPVSLLNYNNGTLKQMTYTCNQSNVIDTSAYLYELNIVNESSTNALDTGRFIALRLNYAITDLGPA